MAKPATTPDALVEPLHVVPYDGGWEFRVGAIATIRLQNAVAEPIARRILGLPDPARTDGSGSRDET